MGRSIRRLLVELTLLVGPPLLAWCVLVLPVYATPTTVTSCGPETVTVTSLPNGAEREMSVGEWQLEMRPVVASDGWIIVTFAGFLSGGIALARGLEAARSRVMRRFRSPPTGPLPTPPT